MHTVLYVLIIIVQCICSSRSVISLHKCHYAYIFLPPFQENSTTCPATTVPPAPPSGLSTEGAIAIGVTLGLLGVAVAVAIIVVVVVVVMHKRRGVGKRSS